jgi:pimeloyl-ACP methyl ester carboxylesterase
VPYASAEHCRIYYEEHGAGPAIVFVHGGGGNTLSWFHQVPYFARRARCILVDLRTFHRSPCPAEHYHPRYFVADLLAVLDAARIERAAFVCQSLGAWAGLPLAVRASERVSALAISGSPTPAYSDENWAVLNKGIALAVAVQRGEIDAVRALGFAPRFVAERPDLVHLYREIGRLNGARRTAAMADESVQLHPRDFVDYRVPTLVMGGAFDEFLTPESYRHVAALIPGAEAFQFAASGHSPYFEEPDTYNAIVGAFLDRHSDVR